MKLNILAISGSLRAASGNTALLKAAELVAPKGMQITIYPGIDHLPHFNPDLDLEGMAPPKSVVEFRSMIGAADGLLISTPEYAHGLPGSLKNALDWVVSSGEIVAKPTVMVNASSRAVFAQASLTETLKVMSARLFPEASITVNLLGRSMDRDAIAKDIGLSKILKDGLMTFANLILNAGHQR